MSDDLTPAPQPPRDVTKVAVPDLTPTELRAEAARIIRSLFTLERLRRELVERGDEVQNRLIGGPDGYRMKRDEGAALSGGVVRVDAVRKGRAWTNKEEVLKDAGELGELAPTEDHKITIKLLSKLPTAVAAELRGLAAREDSGVEMADATKFPTVAQLRAAFGQETKYVGVPPVERSVVLVLDDGTVLGLDGVREVKP